MSVNGQGDPSFLGVINAIATVGNLLWAVGGGVVAAMVGALTLQRQFTAIQVRQGVMMEAIGEMKSTLAHTASAMSDLSAQREAIKSDLAAQREAVRALNVRIDKLIQWCGTSPCGLHRPQP